MPLLPFLRPALSIAPRLIARPVWSCSQSRSARSAFLTNSRCCWGDKSSHAQQKLLVTNNLYLCNAVCMKAQASTRETYSLCMEAAVNTIKKFQTVALITTAAAVGYYLLNEQQHTNKSLATAENEDRRQGHTLTGELVDRDKQSRLAKALDTDCEHCLETRRKLFGMFKNAKEADTGGGEGK